MRCSRRTRGSPCRGLYRDLSTSRLLVLEFVDGAPLRESVDSPERREAGRQLLEAFYKQVLIEGFFHADPHPGNLLWTGEKIVLLDLGMVGELGPEARELLIVLLLAFARNDPQFLSEAVLMLGGDDRRADIDMEALERDFSEFIERFHVASLQDIEIGPMLDGMIRIAAAHGIRLPASLALSGKAFGQVQLAIAELDPSLNPFQVVGDFLARNVRDRVIRQADPQRWFYEGQKLKLRATRLIEAIERATGARPGPKLQVDFLGSTGHRAGDQPRGPAACARGARSGEPRRQRDDRGDLDRELGAHRVRHRRRHDRRMAPRRRRPSLARAAQPSVEQVRADGHHPTEHEPLQPPLHTTIVLPRPQTRDDAIAVEPCIVVIATIAKVLSLAANSATASFVILNVGRYAPPLHLSCSGVTARW